MGRTSTNHAQQTPHAIPRSATPERPQLQSWLKKAETHEQLMVGQKTSRSLTETMRLLEKTDEILERVNKAT